ncbi:apolipoprotein B-100 [Leucoraja erinacea]|uniref:apolipoprotein B-100 n=1 Tax=Leucoraja erinaceus TaxID=7782 RepID=UPI0024566C0A|nr:apolipoprotein B-100 [Leucoraja erinacea]
MGCTTKLSLILLLGSWASAQYGSEDKNYTPCQKHTTRFKNMKVFSYRYEVETSNGILGTDTSRSGVHISCNLELEVPQYCTYSMRIKSCSLKEVQGINADGTPILDPSKDSDAFQEAMSKYILKFTTSHGHMGITLYAHENEPTNILNIKRGIISALLVPLDLNEDEQLVDIATVYGNCSSIVMVEDREGSRASRITIRRDLVDCNKFKAVTDYTSPLAMVTRLPESAKPILYSSQTCSYTLDVKKHVTEAICDEKHLFSDYQGPGSLVKQTLKLLEVSPINTGYFANGDFIKKELTLEHDFDNRAQNADSALLALRNLAGISEDGQREQRADLFQIFVAELRRLDGATLETALPKLLQMEKPRSVIFQALLQCGTSGCFGTILKILQSKSVPEFLADAITYSVGLMASPSEDGIQHILNMAKVRPTRAMLYALSHTVRRFYNERKLVVPELKQVADYIKSIIGNECSGDENKIYLTLKALGNMGEAIEDANPEVTMSLLSCVKSATASSSVQQAAVQAFRQMTLTDEIRTELFEVYTNEGSPVLKRLGAYLIVMKKPTSKNLRKIIKTLQKFENEQVKSFVSTHLRNILTSKDPMVQELKSKVADALKDTQLPTPKDFRKYSRNYNIYEKIMLPKIQGKLEGGLQSNIIFDSNSNLPTAVMLETTLNVFGESVDLFEIGLEGNGFQPSLEAIFGPKGFFPNSAMKSLYWVNGKVPEKVSQVLFKWFGIIKDDEHPQEDMMKELTQNFQKMLKEMEQKTPEVEAFLRIFGNELGYVKGSDFKMLKEMMSKSFQLLQSLPAQVRSAFLNGLGDELFAHYIFMDSTLIYPTGAGLPLKLSITGTVTSGAKAAMKFEGKKIKGLIKPEVATEIVIQLGVNVPDFSRNAIRLNGNIYFKSGFEAEISMSSNQIKFNIPAPKEPVKLLSFSTRQSLIHSAKTEAISSIMESKEESKTCRPLFTGINLCGSHVYSDAPYLGKTSLVLQIEPTGTVTDYSASLTYKSPKIEEDLEHSLRFAVVADGSDNVEVAVEMKYNINKHSLTADVQIPKFDVEVGVKLGGEDRSTQGKTSYILRFDATNKNVREVTIQGQASYNDEQRELMLRGFFSIPHLDVNTNIGTQIRRLPDGLLTELKMEASIPQFKASYKTNFKYDSKKVQVAWNSEATSDLKTLNEKIANMGLFDTSEYQNTLNMHLDNFLDQKVAQTDMTIRHVVFNSLQASKKWLEQANGKVPFAPTIQNHFETLRNMDLMQMSSYFTLPEILFLKNRGSIAGTFGKNKIDIQVPIPFGGKVFEEIKLFPRTVRYPPMAKEVFRINSPSNYYTIPSVFIPLVGDVTSIPSVTIPKTYKLQIPSINKLEFFSQLNSNYYNWTSDLKCESNAKKEGRPFSADVDIKADALLDYLSFKVKGSLSSNQTEEEASTLITGSFKHTLLTTSGKLSTKYIGSNGKNDVGFEWEAYSIGGAKTSLSSSYQFGFGHDSNFEIQGRAKGALDVSTFYSTWNYTMSETINANKEGKGSSILNYNCANLQITNRMNNEFNSDGITFSSNTEGSRLNLRNNIKVRLTSKKYELKCDTSGQSSEGDFMSNIKLIKNSKALKAENKLRGQMFDIAVEIADQLSYTDGQLTLFMNSTGKYNEIDATNSLSVKILEQLEVENKWHVGYNGNGVNNHGVLTIGNDGLSTELTSKLNIDPIDLKLGFTTNVQQSQANMIFDIQNGDNHLVNLNINGRADNSGIYMLCKSSGVILETKASNNINLQLTKEKGLVLHTTTETSCHEATLKHVNHVTVNSWVCSGEMQTDGRLDSENTYQQNFKVLVQPFTLSASYNEKLNYQQLDLAHTGQLLLEPFKIDLKGEFVGKQMAHQVKHTYELQCAEWKALLSANTTGKVLSNKINHKLNLEIVGLSAYFYSDVSCKSKQLQFQNLIRTAALPFVFTLEADTTANGNIDQWGRHNGKLNNKFQMKAEPFAFALRHSYEGISEHSMNDQKLLQTLLKNTLNVILNPGEQTSMWKLEGQFNNNGYMQTINAYNNPDNIGIEIASEAEVDLGFKHASTEENTVEPTVPSKIKIFGNLQYDKNRNVHILDIPFMEDMPLYFDSVKNVILNALDAINMFLLDLKSNQFAQKYKTLLRQTNDYIKGVNLDVKVNEMKDKVLKFVTEYGKSAEQLQLALVEFSNVTVTNMQIYLNYLKEYDTSDLKEAIANFINKIVKAVREIDQQYEITQQSLKIVIQMQKYFEELALQEIPQWIQEVASEFRIILRGLRAHLQNINLLEVAERINQQISTIDFNELIEKLKQKLTSFGQEVNNLIRRTYQNIQYVAQVLEIDYSINLINAKIQKIITKFKLDTLVQNLLDETVQLIKQYQVKETIQGIVNYLKKIDVKSYIERAVQYISELSEQIGLYDFQKTIANINQFLKKVIKDLKEFDYNAFVDKTNNWIQETSDVVNDKIRAFELKEKVRAMTKYIQAIQSSITDYIAQRNINEFIVEMVDVFRNITVAIHNDLVRKYGGMIEDLHDMINKMNVYEELQQYWQDAVKYYEVLVRHLTTAYENAKEKINSLAEENNFTDVVNQMYIHLEEGFIVPELDLGLILVPEFELSIRTVKSGQLVIPSFIVPLTDLTTPSYTFNLNDLKNIKIPTKFEIPAIRILNLFTIPAFPINLEAIKEFIVTTIQDIQNFEIPTGEISVFSDFNFPIMSLPGITIPEIDFSVLQIPSIGIPKVNLNNFMLNDIKIPEFQLPRVPHKVYVPAFGKLSGTFNISSPIYNLHTSVGIHNSTVDQSKPELLAFITAKGKSDLDILSFDLEAKAKLTALEQNQLKLSEDVKLDHTALLIDHKGTLNFRKTVVNGNAETLIKITSEPYTAEAKNSIEIKIDSELSARMETNYRHNLNVPSIHTSSQILLRNTVEASANGKGVTSTVRTFTNGKCSFKDYSDEGLHKNELKFNFGAPALVLSFAGNTDTKYLKMKQELKTEIFPSFNANLVLNADTTVTHLGTSVMNVNGTVDLALLEVKLIGFQNTDLSGRTTGTVRNSFTFAAEPFAFVAKANNNVNVKVSLPMTLTGKVEFSNNYELILNPNEQRCGWQVTSRFNQYKYIHNIVASNNDENIILLFALNGNANLDFLRQPISIPDISIVHSAFKLPSVTDYSLWEDAGLKSFLRTTRQSIDLSIRTEYSKNKDVHDFKIDLTPVYNRIEDLLNVSENTFKHVRNTIWNLSRKIRDDKTQTNPASNDLPKFLQIPGYTIPVVKAEVSPYRLAIPNFRFVATREITTPTFRLPIISFNMPSYSFVIPSFEFALNIPDSFYTLSFPRIKMPALQDSIKIPAMGNLTYDFSLKSSLVTLGAHAELFNQSDIIARYSVSSTSIFTSDFKAEGTTSLARRRRLKLATTISVNHETIYGKHNSTLSLSWNNVDASVNTKANIKLPNLILNFTHDLNGNTKSKPNVQSKVSLDYRLLVPSVGTDLEGNAVHSFSLGDLASYFNLETSANIQARGSVAFKHKFTGSLNNEANVYFSSNNVRSNAKLDLSSSAKTPSGNNLNIEMKENLALEATTKRIFAVWEHSGNNAITLINGVTRGSQTSKATLELAPWSAKGNLDAKLNQPSSWWQRADVQQQVTVSISPESQALKWNNIGHLSSTSFSDAVGLLNNRTEIRLDLAGSLHGHVDFLKNIWLPVYDKNLWDVLKFSLTTSEEEQQYLHASALIVCMKSEDNFLISLPVQSLANGLQLIVPEILLNFPEWINNVPERILGNLLPTADKHPFNSDITFPTLKVPLVNIVVPSYKFRLSALKLPSVFITPEFRVPYTTLQVPSYTINFTNIAIPFRTNILPFEVSLPDFPTVSFPNMNIDSKYVEYNNIPYLDVTTPEIIVGISSFTLPTFFGTAKQHLKKSTSTKQTADSEPPALVFQARTVEIPSLKISLPLAIAIPAFKSLSGNINVMSPIYNTTWIASVKSEADQAVTAKVEATCSSTLRFLEYELEVTETIIETVDEYRLSEKILFSHPDLSLNWEDKFVVADYFRILQWDVAINSPTFTDFEFHLQQDDSRFSSSISTPSTGSLSMSIETKNPDVLYGKLYFHKPPSAKILILESSVSLEDNENIQLLFKWKEGIPDLAEGTKERVPKMIGAVYDWVNKYHTEHLGIEISAVSPKVKGLMKQNINDVYANTVNSIKEADSYFQSTVVDITSNYQNMKHNAKTLYKRATIEFTNAGYNNTFTTLLGDISNLQHEYQNTVMDSVDSAASFLKRHRFQVPGHENFYTVPELYKLFIMQAKQYVETIIRGVDQFVEESLQGTVKYIEELELKVSGTNTVINSTEIIKQLRQLLLKVQIELIATLEEVQSFNFEPYLKSLKDNILIFSEKLASTYKELANVKFETVKSKTYQLYNDGVNSAYAYFTEDLKMYLLRLIQMSQDLLQVLIEKIRAGSIYCKSIREEYFDNDLFRWTDKFNEIDETLIQTLTGFAEYTKEGPHLIDASLARANFLKQEANMFINNSVDTLNEYYVIMQSEFQDDGQAIIDEYLQSIKENLKEFFADMKKQANTYKRALKKEIDDFSYLDEIYPSLIDNARNAVDLFFENCSKFTEQLFKFLELISNELFSGFIVKRAPGELQINVPHSLDWESFDEVLNLKEGTMNTTFITGQQKVQRGTARA